VQTKDAIRYSLTLADMAVTRALDQVEDIPLTFPTARGGCHPLWIAGHLAVIEGLTHEILTGRPNPVAEWDELFGRDSVVTADSGRYPTLAEARRRYTELRRANLAFLDTLSEADLDTPTAKQPQGLEPYFATYGKALMTIALHQMTHRGQLTDTFRTAGRAERALTGAAA
jgi:uncharacterized damage-inducible protein DinB